MRLTTTRLGGYVREIKFRAWDGKRKKMITWLKEDASYCIAFNGEIKAIQHGEAPFMVTLPQGLELMQFTGYRDKHDKPIYGGDIVQFSYEPGTCGIASNMDDSSPDRKHIDWDEGEGCWAWYQLDGKKQTAGLCCYKSVCARRVEVIGNIYENPELLKGS